MRATLGDRGTARIKLGPTFKRASIVHLLKGHQHPTKFVRGEVVVPSTPYQLITLLLE